MSAEEINTQTEKRETLTPHQQQQCLASIPVHISNWMHRYGGKTVVVGGDLNTDLDK